MRETESQAEPPWHTVAPGWLGEPWPGNLIRNSSGVMELGGMELTTLAEQFGTPVYLLDVADFLDRAARFRQAFQTAFAEIGVNAHLFYASKANLNKTIARLVVE